MSVSDASRITIADYRATLHIVASLTDNSRGIIYTRNMFIVQVTGHSKNFSFNEQKMFVFELLKAYNNIPSLQIHFLAQNFLLFTSSELPSIASYLYFTKA